MSAAINGAGCNSSYPGLTGTLTITNGSKRSAGISTLFKTKKTKTKQLNYNHREISGQLMRVRKAQSASVVLTRAKSKLAALQRSAATGDYDSREVAIAVTHARRMVRCAQMKVRNLREEERESTNHDRESITDEQKKRGEVKRRVSQKERQLKQKLAAKEIREVQKEKSERQQILQKRRMHRNQELSKINEADMKYMKAYTENRYGSGSSSWDHTGAVMQLSVAAGLSEAQMMERIEQEALNQIEQEAEAEVEAEMAAGSFDGGMAGEGSMMDAGMMPGGGDVPAPAVDISI